MKYLMVINKSFPQFWLENPLQTLTKDHKKTPNNQINNRFKLTSSIITMTT